MTLVAPNADTHKGRRLLLDVGGLHFDLRDKASGLVLTNEVKKFGLMPKYRLWPGPQLRDIDRFVHCELPITVTFWRIHRDAEGRLDDRVGHRNPIFGPSTGLSPNNICVDALHTVYLGVYKTYCQSVCWSAIESNIFKIEGAIEKVFELSARRLTMDMTSYWDMLGPSQKSRPRRLTHKMLGSRKAHDFKCNET